MRDVKQDLDPLPTALMTLATSSETALLHSIKGRITPSMLKEIAVNDFGEEFEDHLNQT